MSSSTPTTILARPPSASAPGVEVILADTPELREKCLEIRFSVFVDEQGFSAEVETDELDGEAIHMLLRLSSPPKTPLGTVRYVPRKHKLGRLAVVGEHRKWGYGKVLVEGLEEWVKKNVTNEADRMVVLSSQLQAKGFYERCGYTAEGEEYMEEGAPHVWMVKRL